MGKLFLGLEVVVGWLAKGAALLACLALFLTTLLVSVDVLGRWLLGVTTRMAVEVSGYLLVAIVFLSLADTYLKNAHISVDVFVSRLSTRAFARLELVNRVLTILFCLVVFWFTFRSAMTSFRFGSTSRTNIDVTLWPIQMLIPIGLMLLVIVILSDILNARRRKQIRAVSVREHV